MEATHCFDFENPNQHPDSCDNSGMVAPILEYKNCTAQPDGCLGISVTGGYVYRGSHSAWDGKYVFGDWSSRWRALTVSCSSPPKAATANGLWRL
jgi:hypothetical protein